MNAGLMIAALVVALVMLTPGPATGRIRNLSTADKPASWSRTNLAAVIQALPGPRKTERLRSRHRAIELATGLASAVEAGLSPRSALREVIADLTPGARTDEPMLAAMSAAASAGEDVAAVFLSTQREHWRVLGVAWRVGEESGAAFAPILDRVGEALRTEEKVAREADVELSTARSTARLLAVLPVVGILMGRGMGGDPVGFLFGTLAGRGCLVAGVLLETLGLLWTRRLLVRAGGA